MKATAHRCVFPRETVVLEVVTLKLINPLPFPGNRDFGVGHVPWRSPARNPTEFDHIKLYSCGFFDCIPESGGPTAHKPGRSPRFARAAP